MKTVSKLWVTALAVLLSMNVSAQLRLPTIFASNMVLQQKAKVAFWGWATPLEEVTITTGWDNKEFKVKSLAGTGKWQVDFVTPVAGGPYTITVKNNYSKVTLDNILIGEVWLCSGQSNMQWQVAAGIEHGSEEIAKANQPRIRLCNVPRNAADYPQQDCLGSWTECTPESIKNFSAIGYFFGRRLQEDLNVPIGLISSSWGGSPIEIWMKESLINSDENLKRDAATRQPEWSPVKPGAAYNSMIYPLLSFPIAGTIWYQGESNVGYSQTYGLLMKKLIESWRADWNIDFPFYYVQLAPCHYNGSNYNAALIREQQTKALQNSKTGMVVITDLVSDTNNIHPKNKIDVGIRLANLALMDTYGKSTIQGKSPIFKNMVIEKSKVKLTFDNESKGFKVNGKEISGFLIAGDDKKFVPAKAKVEGNTIVLSAKEVKTPVAVRFGFANAAIPNLFSAEGLPVCPFRTDEWEVK